jgi:hypothetical protein
MEGAVVLLIFAMGILVSSEGKVVVVDGRRNAARLLVQNRLVANMLMGRGRFGEGGMDVG